LKSESKKSSETRLSCDEEEVSLAAEEKPRASRSGFGRSGVLTDQNIPVDASQSGVLGQSGVLPQGWNIVF
jgi:hypothetical protein